jgi:iron complex outermembrane receptor protein
MVAILKYYCNFMALKIEIMDKRRRNTKTKQMVMDVLENSNHALCHEDIEKRLTGKMDRVTIYRILQGFYDDGKVHKIISEEGVTFYAPCHNCTEEHHHDNHPHFHCISCDTISCIETPVAEQPLPDGYSAVAFSSLISGYCNKCGNLSKTICIWALLFTVQIIGFAQTRFTVLDRETDAPIACANIYYPDMKTGCVTDSAGQFTVDFTAPHLRVQISAPGYQTFLGNIYSPENKQIIYLQPSVHELQELVVSDNSSRLQGENVMNVEKLSLKSNAVQGISLTDKLTSIAGIDNLSTGAGIGKPVIRGLSGNRIAVFTQGMRLENQQWGDEHGLGLDENGFEHVEIIKGPASILYGSDALGGVLYFIDERYAKNNSIESALHSEFNSNTQGFRNTGTFKLSKDRLHWNLFGGYTTHADYGDGNSNPVPNSRFNTGNLKSVLGYTGDKFNTSLKYAFSNEQYGLTEHYHEEEEEIYHNGYKPAMPYQNLMTHIISSENTFFFDSGSTFKLDAGYIFNNRKEFEDEHEHPAKALQAMSEEDEAAALNMHLSTFSYNAKWHSRRLKDRWALTVGSQGMFQNNINHGEEILIPDAKTLDFGVFAMSSLHYAQKAYWQTGVRFDTRHISSDAFKNQYYSFSFSTGVYQPLTEDLSFRINLSSGFRAPNMYELLSDGIHHGTNRYETGNRNLKTENSYQTDASLNYRTKHLELFLNPYFNYIFNYIYLQPTDREIDRIQVYDYVQADARLYGGEAGFHFHPHPLDWLHIESSCNATFGQDTHNNYPALMPSQKLKATLSAIFSFKKTVRTFSFYVQNLYSLAQNRVAAEETTTPAYNLLNAGIALELMVKRQKLLLNPAVNNMLNKVYYDHLSRYKTENIYNPGRSVNVKITIPLAFI